MVRRQQTLNRWKELLDCQFDPEGWRTTADAMILSHDREQAAGKGRR
jgi:hypothetical protein